MNADERRRTIAMCNLTAMEDAKLGRNLVNRSSLTIDEFRTWLNQLITDKKGALPDMNDWKVIREQLEKVGRYDDSNGPGYSVLHNECDFGDDSDFYKQCESLIAEIQKNIEKNNEYIRNALEENNNGKTKTESDTSDSTSYFGEP